MHTFKEMKIGKFKKKKFDITSVKVKFINCFCIRVTSLTSAGEWKIDHLKPKSFYQSINVFICLIPITYLKFHLK